MLSREEIERYDRQICMEALGEKGQEKLKQAHVFLAGAGGLGSITAMLLAASGVGRIRIVDDGMVELSNLNRQILYGTEDLGKPKAACAKRTLGNLNPHVTIEAVSETIRESNVHELVGSCNLIIDALDNYAARYLLNRVAFQRRISLMHGAVEEHRAGDHPHAREDHLPRVFGTRASAAADAGGPGNRVRGDCLCPGRGGREADPRDGRSTGKPDAGLGRPERGNGGLPNGKESGVSPLWSLVVRGKKAQPETIPVCGMRRGFF